MSATVNLDGTAQGGDADFSLMPELFATPLRPHVRALGRFVRLADAIADTPFLGTDERLCRLERLDKALLGGPPADWSPYAAEVAQAMAESLAATQVPPEHLRHILQAYSRDVRGEPIRTWNDLMLYCRFAAAPLAHHLMDLTDEPRSPRSTRPVDALSAAVRILKRLRDCDDPTVQWTRLCIPRQYLDDAMIRPKQLRTVATRGQARAVLDRVLDGVDRLLDEAAAVPSLLRSPSLAEHATVVLCRARKLSARFRRRDPLHHRVGLSRWQRLSCRWAGHWRVRLRRSA